MVDIKFMKHFWISNKIREDYIKNFSDFMKLRKIDKNEITTYKLAKILNRSYMTVHNWRNKKRQPKLLHFFNFYKNLGSPSEGNVWLWLNLKSDITMEGNPMRVPLKINGWEDIRFVINQLEPIEDNFSLKKEESFAFILGMMIGDVGKLSENRDRLDLQLSKVYKTNKNLGELFCNCVKKLGFKAYRIKGNEKFFRWHTQSSPFFTWIYEVVLGLKRIETTTYNTVKMNWILNSPQNVLKRFLQGIFESDGSVLYDNRITCASFPNSYLIKNILKRFNINSYIINDKGWKRLNIEGFDNLIKASSILFAPEIKSNRYKLLKKIANADRNSGKKTPLILRNIVKNLHNKGFNNYQVSKVLLEKYNFVLSRKTIQELKIKEVKNGSKRGLHREGAVSHGQSEEHQKYRNCQPYPPRTLMSKSS